MLLGKDLKINNAVFPGINTHINTHTYTYTYLCPKASDSKTRHSDHWGQ